jgi:hypothetical protein
MKEPLSEHDARKLKNLNIFRVDNGTYGVMCCVGVFVLLLSFSAPYNGLSRRPATPPQNMEEYFIRLFPYLLMTLPFILPYFINRLVKSIEFEKGIKQVIPARVIFKSGIFFNWKAIIFWPFKFIVFRRTYHFMDVKRGDAVVMELTSLGRLLHYKKVS